MQVRDDPPLVSQPSGQRPSLVLGPHDLGECRGIQIPDRHLSALRRASQQVPRTPMVPRRAGDRRPGPPAPFQPNGQNQVRSDPRLREPRTPQPRAAGPSGQSAAHDRLRRQTLQRAHVLANDSRLVSAPEPRSWPCATWWHFCMSPARLGQGPVAATCVTPKVHLRCPRTGGCRRLEVFVGTWSQPRPATGVGKGPVGDYGSWAVLTRLVFGTRFPAPLFRSHRLAAKRAPCSYPWRADT